MKFVISILALSLIAFSAHADFRPGDGRGGRGGFEPGRGHPPGGGYRPGPGGEWDRGGGRPGWVYRAPLFPGFNWVPGINYGYWQCTAFNQWSQPYSDFGQTVDQAAYNALYDCGGPAVCYVPPGYCQLYR